MKTFKYILVVISILVSNNIFAQEGVFKYDTKKCKYTQIVPADNQWTKTSKNGYTPTSENALMYQKAERCSGWYVQPGVFGAFTQANHEVSSGEFQKKNELSARAELIFGYDFCFGHKDGDHPRNFAMSVEAKVQMTKMPNLIYEDLTYIKSGYVPTVGANVVFQFSKHKPYQIAAFAGAGYTRLTSYYPNANEKALDRLRHNTFSFEGGLQCLWRVKLGQSIGVKAGYEHVKTNMLGRGQVFVGVVYKFKKVHKSKTMTYRDYYWSTKKH